MWHALVCSALYSDGVYGLFHHGHRLGYESLPHIIKLYQWFLSPGQFSAATSADQTSGTATVSLSWGSQSVTTLRIGSAATTIASVVVAGQTVTDYDTSVVTEYGITYIVVTFLAPVTFNAGQSLVVTMTP